MPVEKWIFPFLLSVGAGTASGADPVPFEEAYGVLSAPAIGETSDGQGRLEGVDGRILCGYQGWFRAEGDGTGLGFHHYKKNGKFEPGSCSIDLWPDLQGFDEDERFPTSFRHKDGSVAEVFSSVHPKTVHRHFRWMKEHGIDGAFVQRFATVATRHGNNHRLVKADNLKLIHCRDGAVKHGRCYALMYDLSGMRDQDFERLARDWKELRTRMKLGESSAYLHYQGKPLVAVWGVGFDDDREYTLEKVEWFLRLLKHNPEWGGMSVMLGVPYGWRMQNRDSVSEEGLHKVLAFGDILSPWSVGRYRSLEDIERSVAKQVAEDIDWCRQRSLHYLPVVFPGFSWHNLQGGDVEVGEIPRLGGRFLWKQFTAVKAGGARAAYVAMFDELDEGTAVFPCSSNPPVGESPFLSLEGVPPDHYLWLCGEGGRLLRDEIPSRQVR